MPTKIEWADETLNLFRTPEGGYHCTKVSPGCDNCYAEVFNGRFGDKKPFDSDPAARLVLDEKALEKPFHWKKPRRTFLQSMGDICHEEVQDEDFEAVMEMVASNLHHEFMFLTKRPASLAARMRKMEIEGALPDGVQARDGSLVPWPLPNLGLGVTVEDGDYLWRIDELLRIRAAWYFVSIEPMLGEVDLHRYFKCPIYPHWKDCGCEHPCDKCNGPHVGLGLVILGGETGPHARPCHPDWARKVRDDCQAAGVPFFFKRWGEWAPTFSYRKPKMKLRICRGGQVEPLEYTDETLPTRSFHMFGTEYVVGKMGRKKAGRLLDGRTHDELPFKEAAA